ncbi:hypothetical protein FRC01_001627 [Tulasnella sp. 417]|nr:hypothetical protein FRC01_001627 [Tulasnella sp. 417]
MNDTPQNPLTAPLFEVPDPVEEFGQDGGKFYRCYDALVDEVDEDTVKGLKEQLDGILIFTGLFAAVNTAFLALTLPELSADPADDISALLAQNNAILTQLVMRNDTPLGASPLPSARFSPSRDIFIINALFSLSLAFAIISSFLAVLGRQWLVYYRKRSGGGPDRQRWEQLKRFLGAERWQLEPILDDVLPSLLQIGLIIFCVSFILYLRNLSPAISVIVGIPIYIGLAFFVGSALCTVWDKFCPFQSPLSHVLFWSARTIPPTLKTIKELKWKQLGSASSMRGWILLLTNGRTEECAEALQVIALQRAICTSDDPITLQSAAANIFTITDATQMEQLWGDRGFQERFLKQLESSYPRMLQLRGRDQVNTAIASQRLYAAAAAHIALVIDIGAGLPVGSIDEVPDDFARSICSLHGPWILVPGSQLSELPICFIRSILSFTLLQFSCDHMDCQDWRLFTILCYIISNLDVLGDGESYVQVTVLRDAYQGGKQRILYTLKGALKALAVSEPPAVSGGDRFLISMLEHANQIISGKNPQVQSTMIENFYLLESCEEVLQNPRHPEPVRDLVRKTRFNFVQLCQKNCENWNFRNETLECIPDPLERYLAKVRNVHQAQIGYDESIETLSVLVPLVRTVLREGLPSMRYTVHQEAHLEPLRKTFNDFVLDIDSMYRQIQNNARRFRSPDERWCHWEEDKTSIMAAYSVMPDPAPTSGPNHAVQRMGIGNGLSGSTAPRQQVIDITAPNFTVTWNPDSDDSSDD